jgi:hypothetical protein
VIRVILIALACLLAGCAAPAVLQARTAIPVECREPEPERPAMPTDNLTPEASLDASVQAMQAELVLRDGYEDQLRTAFHACTSPIKEK